MSRGVGQSVTLELPKIAQTAHIPVTPQRNKQVASNSVISVSKYLQVTSKQQPSLPEEEGEDKAEETNVETSSQDCLPRFQSSGTTSLTTPSAEHVVQAPAQAGGTEQPSYNKPLYSTRGKHLNGYTNAVEFDTPNSAAMKLAVQEQLMMLDSLQKEKLISNKAHALGLTSRDWAKSAKAKRMFGGSTTQTTGNGNENENTRHQTNEQERTKYRHTLTERSRSPTRKVAAATDNQTRTSSRMDQATTIRYHTKQATDSEDRWKRSSAGRHEHRSTTKPNRTRRGDEDWRKLEQLKSIYDSSRNNKHAPSYSQSPTRQPSRCGNRGRSSRPVTRMMTSREQKTKRSQNYSRPVTRMAQSRGAEGNSRTTVKEMVDLERRLDESCCWNEIPPRTDSHSITNHPKPVHGSDKANLYSQTQAATLDIDLDDIMLRAKHRSQGGVAMVTMRLRKQRYQHHRQSHRSTDHYSTISPGASPQEIAEHMARVKKRFEGILDIQKPQATTQLAS